jgi:phage shock protein PspC (stress-responsive transcriptional regulator)
VVAVLGGVAAYANIEAEVAKLLLVVGEQADEQWAASMVV